MGLEGEWYCPNCDAGNYLTTKCHRCGYIISSNSPLIKGNPIPEQSTWTTPYGKHAIEKRR